MNILNDWDMDIKEQVEWFQQYLIETNESGE